MAFETELRGLRLFREKAHLLWGLSFTQSLIREPYGYRLRLDEELHAERFGPSEESIHAFVLTFRFFIQNNEACSLDNVTGHIERLNAAGYVTDEITQQWHEARAAINGYLDKPSWFTEGWERDGVVLREENYTNRRIMDIFIYGGLAHSTGAKKELFDNWRTKPEVYPLLESLFVRTIGKFVRVLDAMRVRIIEPAIEQAESRQREEQTRIPHN